MIAHSRATENLPQLARSDVLLVQASLVS